MSMKKNFKRIAVFILAAALVFIPVRSAVLASGSFSVSKTSVTLTQGSSGTVTFSASEAFGAFTISTDGGVSASSSTSYVDNYSGDGTNTVSTITITGNSVGTGHVYIYVYDGADYDGNDLSGKSFTITVTVTSASGGTVTETTTVSQTEAATTAAATEAATEETTTQDAETQLLTVEIDDTEYLVLKEIPENYLTAGFETEEGSYNTVSVQTLVNGDIVLYLLENTGTGEIDYYTLSDSGEFELLKYTTLSGQLCIFLDFPENLDVPEGYSLIETEIYGCEGVQALIWQEAQEESTSEEGSDGSDDEQTSSEGVVEIKSFYTVGEDEPASENDADEAEGESYEDEGTVTVDELTASADDHYYVYCMLGGEKVLCDYDSYYDSLSRCTAAPQAEILSVIVDAEETADEFSWDALSAMEQLLCCIIGGCIILILVLLVILIVLLIKRGKENKKLREKDKLDDIEFIEEDIFEDNKEEQEEDPDEISQSLAAFVSEALAEDKEDMSSAEGEIEEAAEDGPEENGEEEKEEPAAEEDGEEQEKEEFDGNIEVEDISEILAEEFEDIMKYVEE